MGSYISIPGQTQAVLHVVITKFLGDNICMFWAGWVIERLVVMLEAVGVKPVTIKPLTFTLWLSRKPARVACIR